MRDKTFELLTSTNSTQELFENITGSLLIENEREITEVIDIFTKHLEKHIISSDSPENTIIEEGDSSQPNITPEQAQQIAAGLKSGEIKEEEIKQAYDSGQMNDADIQLIQQAAENGGDVDELDPEEKEKYFNREIDQMTDNFVRLGLFDKINDLREKVELFSSTYTDSNDDLINKLNLIKNYLDILSSLVYNLDINIVYQMLITLEIKAIDILREKLGYGPDKELQKFFDDLEKEIQQKEIQLKYSPENIVNGLASGEITEEDLKQIIELGLYSEEEIQEMIEQANELKEQQAQEEQQSEEGQVDEETAKQAEEVAKKIYNKELSADELIQQFKEGKISSEELNLVIKMVEMLKEQNNGSEDSEDSDGSEQEDDKKQEKTPQEVNSDSPDEHEIAN